MVSNPITTALSGWVGSSLLAGVGLVILAGPLLTTVGVLLIILSLMSLMPVVVRVLLQNPSAAGGPATEST